MHLIFICFSCFIYLFIYLFFFRKLHVISDLILSLLLSLLLLHELILRFFSYMHVLIFSIFSFPSWHDFFIFLFPIIRFLICSFYFIYFLHGSSVTLKNARWGLPPFQKKGHLQEHVEMILEDIFGRLHLDWYVD